MGHLFSTNAERGVFKTTDGGKTWQKVLYVNDKIGAVDLAMVRFGARRPLRGDVRQGPPALALRARRPGERDLQDDGRRARPGPASAAACRRAGSAGSASTSTRKIPTSSTPSSRTATAGRRRPRRPSRTSAAARAPAPRTVGNEVYRTDDGGKTWRKVNAGYEAALNKAPYSFNQLRLDQNDPETVYITGQSLASTNDGGKTWKGLSWPSDGVMPRAFGDWRCMWVDPLDSEPPDLRQRRRREHLLRPGQDQPPRLQPPADRVLRRRRGHGGSLQHLRRPAGPRLVERARRTAGPARSRSPTG